MKSIRVDITSAVYRRRGADGATALLKELRETARSLSLELGIQLHNSAERAEVDWARQEALPLSFHAPVGDAYLLNLGGKTADRELAILDDNARRMREYGATMAVFHALVMTDLPVPAFGHGKSYQDCMQPLFRPELSIDGKSPFCRDFTHTDEYRLRQERVRHHLAEIRECYRDLTFCIENDFPNFGNGDLYAANLAALENPICLDTSHLWTTCRVLNLDFQQQVNEFLDSGRVQMMHLHASPYTMEQPLQQWWDGHQPLTIPNQMDLPRVVRNCARHNMRYIVLEISDVSCTDLQCVAAWSGEAEGE